MTDPLPDVKSVIADAEPEVEAIKVASTSDVAAVILAAKAHLTVALVFVFILGAVVGHLF